MKVFLTGKPRSGKTTMCERVFDYLRKYGVDVRGVITKEIVKRNKREGFKIVNLNTKQEVLLAHVNAWGPKIGKYRVLIENIEKYFIPWIEEAKNSFFVIIDEIGPMELLCKDFFHKVSEIVEEAKNFLITVHLKKVNLIRNRWNYEVIEIDIKNRNFVWEMIKKKLNKVIEEWERKKG